MLTAFYVFGSANGTTINSGGRQDNFGAAINTVIFRGGTRPRLFAKLQPQPGGQGFKDRGGG